MSKLVEIFCDVDDFFSHIYFIMGVNSQSMMGIQAEAPMSYDLS